MMFDLIAIVVIQEFNLQREGSLYIQLTLALRQRSSLP